MRKAGAVLLGKTTTPEFGWKGVTDNPLKHAPHTATQVSASEWTHAYPRELAAFPLPSNATHTQPT